MVMVTVRRKVLSAASGLAVASLSPSKERTGSLTRSCDAGVTRDGKKTQQQGAAQTHSANTHNDNARASRPHFQAVRFAVSYDTTEVSRHELKRASIKEQYFWPRRRPTKSRNAEGALARYLAGAATVDLERSLRVHHFCYESLS